MVTVMLASIMGEIRSITHSHQLLFAKLHIEKNVNNALPLKSPRTLGIIGNGAGPGSRGPNGYEDRGGNDGVLAQGMDSLSCLLE